MFKTRNGISQSYLYFGSAIYIPIDQGPLVDVNLIAATKVPIRESEQ